VDPLVRKVSVFLSFSYVFFFHSSFFLSFFPLSFLFLSSLVSSVFCLGSQVPLSSSQIHPVADRSINLSSTSSGRKEMHEKISSSLLPSISVRKPHFTGNGGGLISSTKQNNFISEEGMTSIAGGSSLASFLPETNNLSNQSSSHASHRKLQQQPLKLSSMASHNGHQERESGMNGEVSSRPPIKKASSSGVALPLALKRVLKGEENSGSSDDEQQQHQLKGGVGIATTEKTKGSHSATNSPIADRLKKKKNNLYKKLDPIPIPPFQPIPSFY
jgi:hypothetical protein